MLKPAERAQLRRRIAFQLLENKVVEDAAKEKGLSLTPEQFEARLAPLVKKLRLAGSSYEQMLADSAQTDEEFRRFWNAKWAFEAQFEKELTPEALADFRRRKADEILARKVSHILIQFQGTEDAPPALKRTKEEANGLIEALAERARKGEDFGALARAGSEGLDRDLGGQMPYFSRRGQMPDSFADAAYALAKAGDISAPVETQYGWHIIKLDALRDETEIAEGTRRNALSEKFDELIRARIQGMISTLQFNNRLEQQQEQPGPKPGRQ